ncbi:hypothetical protein JCM8547_002753 [Rhodosporidiobolus lusitaniae]
MRFLSLFSIFLTFSVLLLLTPVRGSFASSYAASTSAAAANQAETAATYGGQRIVPGRFIVEVENGEEEDEGVRRRIRRAGGAEAHLENVLTLLASPPSSSTSSSSGTAGKGPFSRPLPGSLTLLRTFAAQPRLFTGAVVALSDDVLERLLENVLGGVEDVLRGVVEGLEEVEGVKRAWPLRLISAPRPVLLDGAPISTGSLPSSLLSTSSRLSRRAYNPAEDTAASYVNDTFGPHVMTGVDKLHREGVLGEGVKVGIIDTGVDYLNPLLGGCFGPTCPISFGASFVPSSSSSSPSSDGSTSQDPYTSCTSHGTHVTGILASRFSPSLGLSGVAPKATVGHYRVFDCDDSTSEDLVVSALLRAAADDCDVISMSLGSSAGWLGASPSQVVVERLVREEGRNMVVSAGNDRAEGLFFANGPSATEGGISVGSVDVTTLPAFPLSILIPSLSLPYLSPSPLNLSLLSPPVPRSGLQLYFTSTDPNVTDDACGALPEDMPDLSRRVVVVRRGTCTFDEKLAAVQARGAQIILIYNSPTSSNMIPYLDASSTPGVVAVASLRYEEGARLLELYGSRPRGVFVTFPQGEGMVEAVEDTLGGGVVSYFSEYGPTFELFGQPSLTAPGGNILSTFPLSMGGVGVISGTSMSTPFVAGAVALILSQKKDLSFSPAEVRALLATTAKRTATTVNGTEVDTVLLQGGGLVQVDKALATGTIITPFQLALNDTAFFTRTHTLTIRNTNPYAMLYSFSSSPAQAISTYSTSASSNVLPAPVPPSLGSPSARITFSARALPVAASSTATVTLTITAPRLSVQQQRKFPFYSGFVEVTGKPTAGAPSGAEREVLIVSYFGLAARMRDMPVLDTTLAIYGDIAYPFLASGADYQTAANSYGWTTGFDIYTRLASGSRFLSIDLINATTPFTATIPSTRVTQDVPDDSTTSTESRFARLSRRAPLCLDVSLSPGDTLFASLAANASSSGFDSSSSSRTLISSASSSTASDLYSSTPILGTISQSRLLPRDYLQNGFPLGYSEGRVSFVPSAAGFAKSLVRYSAKELKEEGEKVRYKVLIRALRTTADPALASSYESWGSFPFTITA